VLSSADFFVFVSCFQNHTTKKAHFMPHLAQDALFYCLLFSYSFSNMKLNI